MPIPLGLSEVRITVHRRGDDADGKVISLVYSVVLKDLIAQ